MIQKQPNIETTLLKLYIIVYVVFVINFFSSLAGLNGHGYSHPGDSRPGGGSAGSGIVKSVVEILKLISIKEADNLLLFTTRGPLFQRQTKF